jgi:hypothetical protein
VERGDGGDADGEGALRGGGGEGEGCGGAGAERAEEGGVDSGEAGGEKAGGGRGAVERAVAPPARRAEAAGVVLVEVRQEVGLAAAAELVHRHQPFLHGSPPRKFRVARPPGGFWLQGKGGRRAPKRKVQDRVVQAVGSQNSIEQ